MRRTATAEREWPTFEVGPVLELYGGEEVRDEHYWYPYLCPFHPDTSPSAMVNTIIHVFKCHTCDMKGNAVQLIMKKENITYGAALKRAEEIAGQGSSHVPEIPGRRYGVPGRKGNRSGSRTLRRTWRSA